MLHLESAYCQLALKILHCIGIGLQLEDENFFVKNHKALQDPTHSSNSLFRTLYYSAHVSTVDCEENGVTRCGAHTDYGTLTLRIQDDIGGLKVESNGEFIEAAPIEGTVLVNIGDMLQRWTNDQLKATVSFWMRFLEISHCWKADRATVVATYCAI